MMLVRGKIHYTVQHTSEVFNSRVVLSFIPRRRVRYEKQRPLCL